MTRKIFAISITAIFAIAAFAFPIGIADAKGSFLDVKSTKVIVDSSEFEKARFFAQDQIPVDGTTAFGFGIISGAGLEAIAVTTTHAGVKDSEAQSDANDPVFHNHYVALQDSQSDGTGLCPGLEVRDITFEEPGDVDIEGKKTIMEDVPYYFSGTHSLSNDPITFRADSSVGAAVSFTIDPVDGTGQTNAVDIQAVCINDVAASGNLKIKASND